MFARRVMTAIIEVLRKEIPFQLASWSVKNERLFQCGFDTGNEVVYFQ